MSEQITSSICVRCVALEASGLARDQGGSPLRERARLHGAQGVRQLAAQGLGQSQVAATPMRGLASRQGDLCVHAVATPRRGHARGLLLRPLTGVEIDRHPRLTGRSGVLELLQCAELVDPLGIGHVAVEPSQRTHHRQQVGRAQRRTGRRGGGDGIGGVEHPFDATGDPAPPRGRRESLWTTRTDPSPVDDSWPPGGGRLPVLGLSVRPATMASVGRVVWRSSPGSPPCHRLWSLLHARMKPDRGAPRDDGDRFPGLLRPPPRAHRVLHARRRGETGGARGAHGRAGDARDRDDRPRQRVRCLRVLQEGHGRTASSRSSASRPTSPRTSPASSARASTSTAAAPTTSRPAAPTPT